MRRLQKAASDLGARLFRQNSGMAWAGVAAKYHRRQQIWVDAGDVIVKSARPFHAGITGMSDLGGWMTVEVTPEMVGTKVAVYVAGEVKTEDGKPTSDQKHFMAAVRKAGGYAGVIRNEDDLTKLLHGRLDG